MMLGGSKIKTEVEEAYQTTGRSHGKRQQIVCHDEQLVQQKDKKSKEDLLIESK